MTVTWGKITPNDSRFFSSALNSYYEAHPDEMRLFHELPAAVQSEILQAAQALKTEETQWEG